MQQDGLSETSNKKKKKPSPSPVFVLRGHESPVRCCAFSNQQEGGEDKKQLLASGSDDGMLMLWDVVSRRCCVRLPHAHSNKPLVMCNFSPYNPARLWTQGRDGCVSLWDVEHLSDGEGRVVSPLLSSNISCHSFVPCSLFHKKDERDILFLALPHPHHPSLPLVLSLDTRCPPLQQQDHLFSLPAPRKPPHDYGIALRLLLSQTPMSDSFYLMTSHENGSVAFYDPIDIASSSSSLVVPTLSSQSQPLLFSSQPSSPSPVTALAALPDLSIAIAASGNPSSSSPAAARSFSPLSSQWTSDAAIIPTTTGVSDILIRPDGKLFACATWDGKIRFYSAKKNPRPLAVCSFHDQAINCLAWQSPKSHVFAAASSDGKISLWDVPF